MSEDKVYRAIGLMSGTSLDGEIDVALLETDGRSYVKPINFYAHPYDLAVRNKVRACFGKRDVDDDVREAEALITDLHISAVIASGFEADVIAFHGQTITHVPEDGFTWQLGDGKRMATEMGTDVIYDFRKNDMKYGGQGAPLTPLYHRAIMSGQDLPVAVLNLGGVANVTYIAADGNLIAFDCGPANALMDDYVSAHLGMDYDPDGTFAAQGHVNAQALTAFVKHPFFGVKPPKSLDRNAFEASLPALPPSPKDALATLAAFTVEGVFRALEHFPAPPIAWYVCGGGGKNAHIMNALAARLGAPVKPIDVLGYDGDAIEAQCFAYLAVRSLLGLELSLPETTGVATAQSGGVLHKP